MKNNSCAAYADTPLSTLLAAGDCCKSDQCELCFLNKEVRCTDILVELLTDRLYSVTSEERSNRKRETAQAKAKAQRYPGTAGRRRD